MNPSPLNYWTSTLPRATEAVADNLGASSVYIYIYQWEGRHWSSNPEDAGSISSRKVLELHFLQLVPVWVL